MPPMVTDYRGHRHRTFLPVQYIISKHTSLSILTYK